MITDNIKSRRNCMKCLTGNLLEEDLMKKFEAFLASAHSRKGAYNIYRMNEGLAAAICESDGSNFTYLFCEDEEWELAITGSCQFCGSLLLVVPPKGNGLDPLEFANQYARRAFIRRETWPEPELIGRI